MPRSAISWGRCAAVAVWLLPACAPTAGPVADLVSGELVVERGVLEEHLVLTGVVETATAMDFSVPRTDQWMLAIQWLAEDGATVKAGEPIISFDNTAVLDKISELELAAIEAGVDLTSAESKAAVETSDKRFVVTEAETAAAKAVLDARTPPEILSRKEVRDFALARSRAETALAAARGELSKTEKGGKLESSIRQIAFDKANRAYERAGEQLDRLEIKAPRDGIFVVKKHPEEDRKLQVGDSIWPGLTVGGLPDLSKLVIEAQLSDVDEGRIHAGMAASCVIDAYANAPMGGVISSVTPVAQQSEARTQRTFFTVVVELDTTQGKSLRPGLSAAVEVVTRRAEDALVAPRESILFGRDPLDPARVHAVLADGTEVPIEIDFCTGLACVVTSGLSEGQKLGHRARTGEAPW